MTSWLDVWKVCFMIFVTDIRWRDCVRTEGLLDCRVWWLGVQPICTDVSCQLIANRLQGASYIWLLAQWSFPVFINHNTMNGAGGTDTSVAIANSIYYAIVKAKSQYFSVKMYFRCMIEKTVMRNIHEKMWQISPEICNICYGNIFIKVKQERRTK